MTTIKATCPDCGEIALSPKDVVLRLRTAGSTYGFSCPGCCAYIQKRAGNRVVRLLLSGGVVPSVEDIPAEALEPRSGPPIGYDDLIDFHELLEGEGWLQGLAGLERRQEST
jgi:hypothetical protein